MEAIWTFISENILPHWPFVVGYFGFVLVGQFVKAQVWTKKRAAKGGFWHFMRRTLAMHAPTVGLAVGFIPGIPVSPGVEGIWGAVFYWAGCGVFASFSFHAISAYIRDKTGGKLDLEDAINDAVNPSMTPTPVPPKPEA